MPLRYRITLLILILLTVSMVANTSLMVLLARRAILQREEGDGIAITRLLANGVSIAERLPDVMNDEVDRQMIAEAALAAQLVDLARQQGLSQTAINQRLAEVVSRTAIRRIVSLDHDGTIAAQAGPQYDPQMPGDKDTPLADAFAGTGPDKHWAQALPPLASAGTPRLMRYAGVRTDTGNALVVVGEGNDETRAVRREIGPERNISAMIGDAGIESIWIFGEDDNLLARAGLASADVTAATDAETAIVSNVIHTGRPQLINDGKLIHVVAPVLDDDRLPIGAALIRFSTAEMDQAMRHNILLSVALMLVLLLVGALASLVLGRRISKPIVAVADAANAVHTRTYDPKRLVVTARRRDELGSLARHFGEMAEQVLAREEELDRLVALRTEQLNERNQALTEAIDVIQRDLDAARSLQQAILPQHFPAGPNFNGVAIMTAALHVGGDFYDFFMVDEDHLAVVIADVSGKGVPAALFMAVSRTVLRAQAQVTPDPSECMVRVNDQMCSQNPMDLFITVFYGLLNIRTGQFDYVNAGHPPPVLLRKASREVAPLPRTDGMAVGVMDEIPYRSGRVDLEPGDALVLYTDGVSEAMDEAGLEFTDARVVEALAGEVDHDVSTILANLIDDVHLFVDGAPQSDDLTCVVMRYVGDPAVTETAAAPVP
jgi:sigma-B regulation protein RsbU (phosphoserine phosphatase)